MSEYWLINDNVTFIEQYIECRIHEEATMQLGFLARVTDATGSDTTVPPLLGDAMFHLRISAK